MENSNAKKEQALSMVTDGKQLSRLQQITEKVIDSLDQTIVGQKENIRCLWNGLLIGGHVLLEGVPGLGKTLSVRALSQVIDGGLNRVQFTPDLMPSDVTGNKVYDMQTGQFLYQKGPIFSHILLADEINRTPPKTQAALLEAMEERQVTIDGESFALPELFFVVATQNPVDYEGTYVLPEAQLDRFSMKLLIDYPEEKAEISLLTTHQINERREKDLATLITIEELLSFRPLFDQVTISDEVIQYLLSIIKTTRHHPKIALGASPRAGLNLLSLCKVEAAMNGREYITPDDVKYMVKPSLRHRILLKPDGELEGWHTDDILEEIVEGTVVPR